MNFNHSRNDATKSVGLAHQLILLRDYLHICGLDQFIYIYCIAEEWIWCADVSRAYPSIVVVGLAMWD